MQLASTLASLPHARAWCPYRALWRLTCAKCGRGRMLPGYATRFHLHDSNFTLRAYSCCRLTPDTQHSRLCDARSGTYDDEQRVTPTNPLLVAKSGPDSGLTLVFNVGSDVAPQQDVLNASRTHGGAITAGIRVVVHDRRTAPDLGSSILAPPGFNTLVGVQRHRFKRMTTPHGKCVPAVAG